MHSMFKQPSEVQRKVERIKLLNISLKPLVLSSRDSFNIPATSSLSSFRSPSASAPAPATSSRSCSASSQQHTKGYHLVSTPHNSRNNNGSNSSSSSSSSSSRSRTLLYRLIVQTFLALFLVTKCCDAAKQDGKHAGYKYRCF